MNGEGADGSSGDDPEDRDAALDRTQAKLIGEELPDGGAPRAERIREAIKAGLLFELTWTEEASSRTLLVIHVPIDRPSAKPLHGPPTFRFNPVGGGDPFRVQLPAIEALAVLELTSVPTSVLPSVARTLVSLAVRHPDRITTEDATVLLSRIDSPEGYPHALAIAHRVLGTQRRAHTQLIEAVLGVLRSDAATRWDDPIFARPATFCLGRIAETDPSQAFDFTPQLAIACDSADQPTRRAALYALAKLAGEYPEEVLPALDCLVAGVRADDDNLRNIALSALGRIVQSYPNAAEPLADEIAQQLTGHDGSVRANAAGLFGDLAVGHPTVVMRYADDLLTLLADEHPDARRNASIALLRAGEADPAVFREHTNRVARGLDDDVTEVRRNLCSIIGNAGVQVPRDKLQQLAANDPDNIVRERAAWAAARLR